MRDARPNSPREPRSQDKPRLWRYRRRVDSKDTSMKREGSKTGAAHRRPHNAILLGRAKYTTASSKLWQRPSSSVTPRQMPNEKHPPIAVFLRAEKPMPPAN